MTLHDVIQHPEKKGEKICKKGLDNSGNIEEGLHRTTLSFATPHRFIPALLPPYGDTLKSH
jgi:hypothetical protein